MTLMARTDPRWKHTTSTRCLGREDQEGIDLFDDEDEGQVSIYVRYKDGTRWPARTVDLSKQIHACQVLGSWMQRGKINDYRENIPK